MERSRELASFSLLRGPEDVGERQFDGFEGFGAHRFVGGGGQGFQVTFGSPAEDGEREPLGIEEPLVGDTGAMQGAQFADRVIGGVGSG